MIPLTLPAAVEAQFPFITRLRLSADERLGAYDSILVDEDVEGATFVGSRGILAIDGVPARTLAGDIVLADPMGKRVERLLRAGSPHNTLLVTERCDQLCQMCSQPPKKTHEDRFAHLEEACLLAEPDTVIGVTGGEPTLYKDALLGMIERVLSLRPDLEFHVLSNGQHFEQHDMARLGSPLMRRICWGIPLYAAEPCLHDEIVGKEGAFLRLEQSFATLMRSGARIELRTVLLSSNIDALRALARYVTARLRFIESWSIMQLENIGFAKNRWPHLFVDHAANFGPIADALDSAILHGIDARLFNFPRCTVPIDYRDLAAPSISDWKRKYMPACSACREKDECAGFFEWHPEAPALAAVRPL